MTTPVNLFIEEIIINGIAVCVESTFDVTDDGQVELNDYKACDRENKLVKGIRADVAFWGEENHWQVMNVFHSEN